MEVSGKRVLVTGADGFIGSHLTERLLAEGCSVRAFVCYNSFNSWGWLDSLPPAVLSDIDVFPGDIRDPNGVRQAMRDVDIVMHLAALIAIPFSYHSPDAYVDTNIKGTLNVLQAARDAECERVMVTSTSEVYGTARYVPIDEQHPYQGQSPYSASKIGADRLAESFHRSFATPVTIVRPFNTYGPRQSARAVIPTLITQLLSGQRELHLGALSPTRDFVFVEDTVAGFLAIARADATVGEEINIATEREISIGDLVEKLKRLTGADATVVTDEQRLRPDASEVFRLLGANGKIRRLTDWTPRVDLDQGLARTVEWFRANARSYKTGIYNI
ncbi:MAG: SDR family NAD(P)-dependent oxidoreductase [Gemmatimonadaceae bacterium]|nr:SDR family NAD(P)-dependent oxidoreductase [Gemmatimonadaceae bacterium]NUO93191.1 SDR family NAD(P)-dependent oxidoreductase [Gemmatimonadaceae bacterium]NUP54856.1 SDR family NAD(P)-dependent oxidoreductase [Gemmatimonadaceae bacterium]NUP71847.1 SDR family NAD(P)-dependent oxidoreductase [Gemmatimonadaceae bacterium]NUR33306.1 SDR family NAD(P)-dependent oxidoreductase [Gemmatimonadaceae bacterium]